MALVSRSPLAQTASFWAQGGIAAALAEDDSPELHADDTIRAGRELARASAVRVLCEDSPASVHDLQELGVQFDADRSGNLALGLEGGHSRRRIVHAGGSATGRRITRDLSAIAATDELITVLEPLVATALLTHEGRCVGLVARSRDGEPRPLLARAVILATGGMAALWRRTTNPRGAIGAGLTLAEAAGARLADLEFMQFHPTALRRDGPRDGFLITEAVRGEGAKLLNAAGERFVDELAPRDQVALAIQSQLDATGSLRRPRHARARPRPLPQHRRRARRGRHRPGARARPGRAGRALHDGRRRRGPRRQVLAARPVRGRRVRLHRPARRQPACLELAGGVLRVRPPRRPAATADPEPPAAAAPAEPEAPNLPPDETRAAFWSHAGLLRRTPSAFASCSTTPTRSPG